MPRQLIVNGAKVFRITIPDDARVTFGPFSPPSGDQTESYARNRAVGTLRIYKGGSTKATESVLAVFTDVRGFRDIEAIDFEEQVTVEQGAVIWNSDRDGYKREEKVSRKTAWADPEQALPALASGEVDDDKEEF